MKNSVDYFLMVLFLSGTVSGYSQTKQPVDYVDNRTGVLDEYSNCVIGPQLPFGSINPSPQTKNGNDDGYNPNEPIRGFGQLHVSGTGWGTNGQIFLSPQIGLAVGEIEHDSPKSNESAHPYEYKVTLNRYKIGVQFTPSLHSAIYKFNFPKSDSANILFDITHNIPMDIKPIIGGTVSEGIITINTNDHKDISGSGIYDGGFGGGAYKIYFYARVNKMPMQTSTWLNGNISVGSTSRQFLKNNDRVGAILNFSTRENEEIYLKIAISYKSIDHAKKWLEEEIPEWNYNKVRDAAKSIWNEELKKITVEGGTEKDKTIFYTAMYHTQLMPRNRTNDYQCFDKDVPVWDDHFAIWDTWRTVYPLHLLINPEMVSGTVNSFIARFKKNGYVKDAFINGNDMPSEQGGNNVDNIIADAYLKNIKGVDWEEAYKILKYDADYQRLGSSDTFKEKGWIPAGIGSCSVTMEYCYNDYCTALVAKGLGRQEDYKKYLQRSKQWVNLWNKDAESDGFKGFIMPRKLNGDFVAIDLKKNPSSWRDYFYEGSSWTYSWFAPHDFEKLVELNGGSGNFVKKLDYGFKNDLIDYSNEPAFLAVQGFHYAGRPDLSSYWVRKLLKESFTEKGLPGNDDSGAMSAWYIFSAMGFFPNAGQNIYYLTGPLFTGITIHLGNDRILNISAPKASETYIYMHGVSINGKKLATTIIDYDEIKNGGTILFDMSDKPLLPKSDLNAPLKN